MTQRTISMFICDKCGVKEEGGGNDRGLPNIFPEGWSHRYIPVFTEGHNSGAMFSGHTCKDCTKSFIQWFTTTR